MIMPDVVNVPHSALYDPDEKGVDGAGYASVLTGNEYAPGGAFTYSIALVEVQKA